MATAAQIAANRRNAARSTGPKTVEGKDRARMNALMHGLFAVPSERPEEAVRRGLLREQLITEWRPGSTVEAVVLDQMADVILQLERLPEARAAGLALLRVRQDVPAHVSDTEMLAADMMSARPRLILIDQYQQRLSRQLARLTRDLRQLQQDRAHCDVEAENDADAKADGGEGEAQTEIVKTNPIRPEAVDLQEVAPVPVPSPARGAAPLNEQSGPLGRPALPAPSLVRDLHLRRPAAETRERLSA